MSDIKSMTWTEHCREVYRDLIIDARNVLRYDHTDPASALVQAAQLAQVAAQLQRAANNWIGALTREKAEKEAGL